MMVSFKTRFPHGIGWVPSEIHTMKRPLLVAMALSPIAVVLATAGDRL
jgi:hypothetical protein